MKDKFRQRREDTINNGFWDLPPKERSERMRRACERAGVDSFWDLEPEERGRCYDEVDWENR